MREELQTIVAFVEGKIDPKELQRQLFTNPARFEQLLKDDPNLPDGYLEQGVYQFIIQQDFNHFADVLNIHRELQNYLARNAIVSDGTGADRTFFSLLYEAQPEWLCVVGSDYFLTEVLPGAGDRAGDELRDWIHVQLLERFQYVKEPPNWIQGQEWPINENGPMVFLGEVVIGDNFEYFGDDAAAYVFYDATDCTCETILQVA